MEEQIIVDAQSARTPFPHFWEHMFGSCHASITLCEDWRKDLRAMKEIVDVRYVRFHGIFEHQAGIYNGLDEKGNLKLNFTNDVYRCTTSRLIRFSFEEKFFMMECLE